MTDTPSDDDGRVTISFVLKRGALYSHEQKQFIEALAKIAGIPPEEITLESQLTPVRGVVARTVHDGLNYVALEDNTAGKHTGLLDALDCEKLPRRGYLKSQASVFRVGDKVEGFVNPLGTDRILDAKVTPVRGRKPGL